MYKFLIIALVLGIVCSCSKSEQPPKHCLVGKIVTMVTQGGTVQSTTTQTFTYNSQFQLTSETSLIEWPGQSSSTDTYNYTYKDGEVSLVTNSNGTCTWTQDHGRVTSIVHQSGSQTTNHSFTYDTSGYLTNWTAHTLPADYPLVQNTTYNASGNITTNQISEQFLYSELDYTINLAGYDNHKNPWSLLADATNQPYYHNTDGSVYYFTMSKNNPGTEVAASQTATYSYTYNSQGYPTLITWTSGNSTQARAFTFTNCD